MKNIKTKLTTVALAATMLVLPFMALSGSVSAVGEGGVEGGEIYRVRNVTAGGDFTDPVGANKCETLQYKVRIHNPGPSPISNVNVKVDLPSAASTRNVSTAVISASDAYPTSTSDTATVNLSSSLKISYVSGSTQLLDANNGVISSLPDGITSSGSGVNIGNVGVSTQQKRYVQFSAKTECPEKPPVCTDNPKTPEDECNPDECKDNPKTPENECKPCKDDMNTPENECKPATPGTPGTPTGSAGVTELANTGAGEVAGMFAAAVIAGVVAFRVYLGRRLSSQ